MTPIAHSQCPLTSLVGLGSDAILTHLRAVVGSVTIDPLAEKGHHAPDRTS